ncbi:hypothetical protein JCM5353_004382 [Sporobolomyces roseus]
MRSFLSLASLPFILSTFVTALPSSSTSILDAVASSDSVDPSPSGFKVLPRGPFVASGVKFKGPAFQSVNWSNATFGHDDRRQCVSIGWSSWFGNQPICTGHWYERTFPDQAGVACPNNTITGGDLSWISVSTNFLKHNGSLRKACGRRARVTAGEKSIDVEVRRSCSSETVCPGENAIALSPYVANELDIQNDVFNGSQVTWTYL